jgi:hypothetical protein
MMEDEQTHDNSLEYSEGFMYPAEPNNNTDEELERLADEIATKKIAEFINKLLSITIPAHNTRITLIAFAIACGVNVGYLLNCEDTLASISKSLGCTKAALSAAVNTISEQYHIKTYTGIQQNAKSTYKTSNYRQPTDNSRIQRTTKRKSRNV